MCHFSCWEGWHSVKGVANESPPWHHAGRPRCAGCSCSNPLSRFLRQQSFAIYRPATIATDHTVTRSVPLLQQRVHYYWKTFITAWNAVYWNVIQKLRRPGRTCYKQVHLLYDFQEVVQHSLQRSPT